MGNRAVITTPERKVGLYLHWNGGRDTIEPLLRYCELKGYRPPSADCYGWARMCQVLGNFFGGTLSIGIDAYTTDSQMDPGDNGIYVIEGWRIVEHLRTEYDSDWNPIGMRPFDLSEELAMDGFDDMIRAFDEAMPAGECLGAFLDSEEVPTSELAIGDEVWLRDVDDSCKAYPVIGFMDNGTPLVERCPHGEENPNNRIRTETCRIKPRE